MDQTNRTANFGAGNTISKPRLAAVIPALNEGRNIEAVVSQIIQQALVIVVDDGSTDDTAKRARGVGACVVCHPDNRGYDAALETGIRAAIAFGCTFAVTMDADGQHDPSLLDRFDAELEAGADLVIGMRDHTQRWSEVVFACVGHHLWGLHDPLCGMKGYRLKILSNVEHLNTYASIGTELAIRAVKTGVKIIQLPVHTRPREGTSRFGSGFKANMRIIKSLFFGMLFARSLS